MAERAIEEARRQVEIDTKRLEDVAARIKALETDIADQRETPRANRNAGAVTSIS